jgi:VIT1/CCC1 family predicted Fe2+/Mn2+ transporter
MIGHVYMISQNEGVKAGLHFGLTSGVITTLGLMVGLHAGTHSTLAVVGGILTIAIADSMSDALGVHIAKEAENTSSSREVWAATVVTMLTKLVMASTFIVPVLLLDLQTALAVSVIWGLAVLAFLSYRLAVSQGTSPVNVIVEHLVIAVVVIVLTHAVGDWVSTRFN